MRSGFYWILCYRLVFLLSFYICISWIYGYIGIVKGDFIEVNWVGEEFSCEDEVLIGSVKGNIG